MEILIWMGGVWLLYGLAGVLFGRQNIKKEYRGHSWTLAYQRELGLSWVMLGGPYLLLGMAHLRWPIPFQLRLLAIVLLSMPALIYTVSIQRRYREKLGQEQRRDGAGTSKP